MSDTCEWREDDPNTDLWETECGKAYGINEGSPTENRMNFCCFCGKKIAESRKSEDEDDGE